MVNIAERPAEADDRAVPGHWGGRPADRQAQRHRDCHAGRGASGFAMLVPLPDGYRPEHVAPALAAKGQTLPEALRRSLT
jgi:transposase, IS30 family